MTLGTLLPFMGKELNHRKLRKSFCLFFPRGKQTSAPLQSSCTKYIFCKADEQFLKEWVIHP